MERLFFWFVLVWFGLVLGGLNEGTKGGHGPVRPETLEAEDQKQNRPRGFMVLPLARIQ